MERLAKGDDGAVQAALAIQRPSPHVRAERGKGPAREVRQVRLVAGNGSGKQRRCQAIDQYGNAVDRPCYLDWEVPASCRVDRAEVDDQATRRSYDAAGDDAGGAEAPQE